MSTLTEMRIEKLVEKSMTYLAKISDNQEKLINNTTDIVQTLKKILAALNQSIEAK